MRRRSALGLLAALVVVVAIVALAGRGSSPAPALLPDAKAVLAADPLAWTPDRSGDYAARAAAGLAHVLYAKSPGGLVASAQRTATWRPLVERAARAGGLDPDTLEAIVLLESAGLPEAQAGTSLEGAVGLTQILAQTGSGLLGMHVDVAASRRLTRRIARAEARGQARRAQRLRAQRRHADERFDPAKELAATVRYLALARGRLGRDDLAIASYHMGIGNLQTVLARYGADRVPYVQLFFDTTPLRHRAAWRFLAGLGDDSSTYLWRIGAAREAMRMLRADRAGLVRAARLQTATLSAAQALHPPGEDGFADDGAIGDALGDGTLVRLPRAYLRAHGIRVDPALKDPGLRRPALAALAYAGAQVARIAPGGAPLDVVGAAAPGPADLAGWSFDVARAYASHAQALAFQFVLDRLTALNLIAWSRAGTAIHVTVSADAARLERPLGVRPG